MSSQSLYGAPRPPKLAGKEITNSTTLAFESELSSLLSAPKSSGAPGGRARPSSKSDIFSAHNRNTSKRAAKDLEPDNDVTSRKRKGADFVAVDEATLYRSKRKMEEKSRIYAAMKRGDYVTHGSNKEKSEGALVDFDRKWAENEERGESNELDTSSDDGPESEDEHVEFVDEFGRRRMGSKREAAREMRRKRLAHMYDEEDDALQPTNIIYGDTIQSAAFNPDEPVMAQMEALAKKRDRSATPPPEVHYDATSEVRTKGVGFYAFSKDKAERQREMDALEKERFETEKLRDEQQARKSKRKVEIEERKKRILEQKGRKQADMFLAGLDL